MKVFVQRGGWFGGLQIGIHGLGSFKKFHQTVISATAAAVRGISRTESFSNAFKHLRILNLKQRRNGHICVMWLRQPIRFCKSKRETFSFFINVAIKFLYFEVFSFGSFQDRVVVSKIIPRTLPCVEFEKALSNNGHSGAKGMPRSLQVSL